MQSQGDIRRARINSLSGLKVVALALIFTQHLGMFALPDFGARMCEFFFACSGVLEAIRHFGTYDYTFDETFYIFLRKLKKTYPVYIITFIFAIALGQLGATA